MIELYCEYLSVQCIWLYVLVMPRTHFRVNPHAIFAWMSRNSSLQTGAMSEVQEPLCQLDRLNAFIPLAWNTELKKTPNPLPFLVNLFWRLAMLVKSVFTQSNKLCGYFSVSEIFTERKLQWNTLLNFIFLASFLFFKVLAQGNSYCFEYLRVQLQICHSHLKIFI